MHRIQFSLPHGVTTKTLYSFIQTHGMCLVTTLDLCYFINGIFSAVVNFFFKTSTIQGLLKYINCFIMFSIVMCVHNKVKIHTQKVIITHFYSGFFLSLMVLISYSQKFHHKYKFCLQNFLPFH